MRSFLVILITTLSLATDCLADGPHRSTKRAGIKDCGHIENVKITRDVQIAVYGITNLVEGLVSTANLYWDILEGSDYPQGDEQRTLVLASKAITGEVLTSKRDYVQYGSVSCNIGRYVFSEFDWTYTSSISKSIEKNQVIWTAGSIVSECHYSWEYLTNDGNGDNWHTEDSNNTGVLITDITVIAVRAESDCRGYRRRLVSEFSLGNSDSSNLMISNYPEPFNPITNLVFDVHESNDIVIDLYDIKGSKISTITNKFFSRGRHEIQIDASWLPSGSYFVVASIDGNLVRKKLTLSK